MAAFYLGIFLELVTNAQALTHTGFFSYVLSLLGSVFTENGKIDRELLAFFRTHLLFSHIYFYTSFVLLHHLLFSSSKFRSFSFSCLFISFSSTSFLFFQIYNPLVFVYLSSSQICLTTSAIFNYNASCVISFKSILTSSVCHLVYENSPIDKVIKFLKSVLI